MKKLIIKTIALTSVILLVLTVGLYLLLAYCFPSVLSNWYFNLQNESLTLKYSEKSYQTSGDVFDLCLLTERSIVFDNDEAVLKHATELINHDNYDEVLSKKGNSYHYYIVGSLCQAQYIMGSKAVAIETAFSNTLVYTEQNPVHRLIVLSAREDDVDTLKTIKQKLTERQDKNNLLESHLALIEQLIN